MKRLGAAIVVLLLVPLVAAAQEGRGFAEVRVALYPGASGKVWQTVERVRPSLSHELAERVRLVATVEAGLAQGRDTTVELERALRASGLGPLLDASGQFPTYANPTLRIDRADDYLDVDRLYVDVYGESFDLRIGRQALNWGSAQFFNPTDPFPEVLLAEPWRPRRGVNAARLTVPVNESIDASAVLATNDVLNELRAAARVRLNWKETDFALVGAWRGENRNALVGVDLRGTLVVGWWVEAAYLFGATPHEELSVGVDYSFPLLERATVFLQYYRNGAGDPNASGPGQFLTLGATRFGGSGERDPFAPFTRGRDYGMLGASLAVNAELTGSVAVLQNLNDGSGFGVPTVSYAALDWLDVAASVQVPYALRASGGEFKPRAEELLLSFPGGPSGAPDVTVDLRGLVPTATFTVWSRASF